MYEQIMIFTTQKYEQIMIFTTQKYVQIVINARVTLLGA